MDKIIIGNIKKSVGLLGYFKFNSTNPNDCDYLFNLKGKDMFIENRKFIVEDIKMQGDDILIKFKGIADARKDLSNKPVYVERSLAAPLEEGEYYFADLEKCKLKFAGSDELHDIISIIDLNEQTMIEIKIGKQTIYVPFHFVLDVKLDEKLIIADSDIIGGDIIDNDTTGSDVTDTSSDEK